MRALLTALVLLAALPAVASASRMPAPTHLVRNYANHPACVRDGVPLPCADLDNGEIWVPRGAGRYAVAHETGHLWYFQVPTAEQRAYLDALLTRAGHDAPEELAAEAYATCDLGYSPRPRRRRDGALVVRWPVAYDYNPSARLHRTICNTIAVYGLVAAYGSGTTR